MMRLYARDGDKHYRLDVSREWADKNDNGALFSCGLTVGKDIKPTQLKALIARGQAVEVPADEFNHSGCQSSCVKRGDATCRW